MKLGSKLFLTLLMTPAMAMAAGQDVAPYFNFDGVLTDSSGNPISTANTPVQFRIYDPAGNCLLYAEKQDISPNPDGTFSVQIGTMLGDSKRSNAGNDQGYEMAKIFQNLTAFAPVAGACPSGWMPVPGAGRSLEVVVNGQPLSPRYALGSVPTAKVAETLNGKTAGDFLQYNMTAPAQLNQANLESVFSGSNYANLLNVLAGNVMPQNPTAPVSFNNQKITNVAAPVAVSDAVNKGYADSLMGGKSLDFTGVNGTTGNGFTIVWDQANNKWVTGPATATDPSKLPLAGGAMAGAINMVSNDIMNTGHITMSPARILRLSNVTPAQETTLTGAFTAADKGSTWFNSTTNAIRYYDGASVQTLGAGGGGITALTGDVTASGAGSVAATISPNSVTSAKIADFSISTQKVFSNPGVNRLLATDGSSGTSITPFACAIGQTMIWQASGWGCSNTWMTSGPDLFLASGKVGIGTSVPSAPIDIYTPMGAGIPLLKMRNPSSNAESSMMFVNDGAANFMMGVTGTSDFANAPNIQSNTHFLSANGGNGLTINTNGGARPIMFNIDGTERMHIDGTGRVGIGTSIPMTGLHVAGSILVGNGSETCSPSFSGAIRYNGTAIEMCNGSFWGPLAQPSGPIGSIQFNGGAGFMGTSGLQWDNSNMRLGIGTPNPQAGIEVVGGNPTTPVGIIRASSSQSAPIFMVTDYSMNPKLLVHQSGNVGIGTTNPSVALQVANGAIVGTEVVVPSGSFINAAQGNTFVLQSMGGSSITLSGPSPGTSYTVVVEDMTSRTYTFSGCGTTYYSPANGLTTNRSIYNITYVSGGKCYVDWKTGYN